MYFTFRDRQISYESYGEGKPLLLLNGIMMNTSSWAPFVEAFRQGGNRVLLVDLLDQGKSAAFPEGYGISDQAEMVNAFIHHLGLEQVSVMGTSYGGTVALSLTANYPRLVDRLMLAGTRAWTDPLFRDMCESWLHACGSPAALYTGLMPLFYGATFQHNQQEWLLSRRALLEKTAFSNPEFVARLQRLIRSFFGFDLRDRLGAITCPTLVVTAEEDLVMMPWEQHRIAAGIPKAHLVTLHRTGHVMFLERPDLFVPLMMGWFNHRDAIALP